MIKDNSQFLEDNRGIYNGLIQAGIIVQLDYPTRERYLSIIHQEFDPNYIGNLWCQDCVMTMIKYAYTQYDKQPKAEPAIEDPVIIKKETFPKHDAPVVPPAKAKKARKVK